MSYLRGNPNAGLHPAENIVSVLEQDRAGNPILWIGGDNRVYGFDERGQLADFTDWYMAQQNRAMPSGGFGGQAFGQTYNQGAFGQNTYGYNQSAYEPSPATTPRGFNRGATRTNTGGGFGYEDYNQAAGVGNIGTAGTGPSIGRTTTRSDVGNRNTNPTNASTRFNREKREVVVDDFTPVSGSEMIPLYDEDRETLEVEYDYDNKLFKLLVK